MRGTVEYSSLKQPPTESEFFDKLKFLNVFTTKGPETNPTPNVGKFKVFLKIFNEYY